MACIERSSISSRLSSRGSFSSFMLDPCHVEYLRHQDDPLTGAQDLAMQRSLGNT
jgi:hypothetical protein